MSDKQAPADWYPVEGGKLRYWDGAAWTDHFADRGQMAVVKQDSSSSGNQPPVVAAARGAAVGNMELPEGTIWSAVGQSVAGMITGRYRLDIYYLYAAKGALRTNAQQVPIAGVVDVDLRQSMTQKARGVYTVLVHAIHDGRRETIRIEDIRDGSNAQQAINQTARDARLMLEHRTIHIEGLRHQVTSTVRQEIAYEGLPGSVSGMMPTQAVPFIQASSQYNSPTETPAEIVVEAIEGHGADPLAQLRELGSLRDGGILTEDEFAAKKAEILKRL